MITHRKFLRTIFVNDCGKPTVIWRNIWSKAKHKEKIRKRHHVIINAINNEYEYPWEFFIQLRDNLDDAPICEICHHKIKYDNKHYVYPAYCCKEHELKGRIVKRLQSIQKSKENYHHNNSWDSNIPMNRYDNLFYNACYGDDRFGYSKGYWNFVNTDEYAQRKRNILKYVKNRFDNITFGITEVLYRIEHKIEECPKCKICGKPAKYDNGEHKYTTYCCRSCRMKDKSVQDDIVNKSTERYGDRNNRKQISKSIRQYFDNRTEEKRLQDNKAIANGLNRRLSNMTEEEITNDYYNRFLTKKQNGNARATQPEKQAQRYLWYTFRDAGEYVKFEYKSDKYPYKCDFYIPCLDVYIELQGFWTHGPHPFSLDNIDDLKLLEKWKIKANQGKPLYKSAIKTWTQRDVKKRETAKLNSLEYYEVKTFKEFKLLVDKLYEIYIKDL